jgi:AraC family transcriptional regulator
MIEPIIKTISEKKLVGMSLRMSLAENKTFSLWQSFMPRRKEISDALSTDLISMQVYDAPLQAGNMLQVFDKWAAVEVSNFDKVPEDMNTYTLVGGLYAVFHYKGLSTDSSIFRYIYGEWLPNSNYVLDQRPHFEVLGPKYKNNDPNSEEEIWVPLKLR